MKMQLHWSMACVTSLWICLLGPTAATAQEIEFTNPIDLSAPNGFSHVVVVNRGKLVLISGQVGTNKEGNASPDFAAQAQQAFSNIKTALEAVGAKPTDLVKLNFFVVGLNREKILAPRAARDTLVNTKHPPVSTLLGVQPLFRCDLQIAIEAEAVIEQPWLREA
jgi:enamine deaminase RidA (YjgF/YER057c/UK114 family)